MVRPLIAMALTMGSVFAQESTTGTLYGRVVDQQGAVVPGASILITSTSGARSLVSDSEGRFMAPYLTPGLYSVRVELAGFVIIDRPNVDVRLGQRTELEFPLKVGGVAETVTVLEAAPVVDVTSTTSGGSIDSDLLERIPVGRQLSDALYLVPGVSSGGLTGEPNPSIGGGAGLDNQYYIDGANVSDGGYGSLGVYSQRYNTLGQGVTYEFIDEVQVKTGGYGAEFGQSTGGVVNVITKSGTNTFSGNVFSYVQSGSLEGERKTFDWINGRSSITGESRYDVGFSVGGPIVHDRAYFFGAFHPQWNTRTFLAPDGFPLRNLGEVDRERRFLSYAAKASLLLTSNHRLDASFFGDPATSDTAPQDSFGAQLLNETNAGFSRLEFGGNQQVVKYQGILGPDWLLEASFARAESSFDETPSADEWRVNDFTVAPVESRGGIGAYETSDGENLQYRLSSTHLLGSHQIRYGFAFEDIQYDSLFQRTGPSLVLPDGTPTMTGASVRVLPDPTFGRIYQVRGAATTNVRPSHQDYLSFFIQDQFNLSERLTVSAGIRYDQQRMEGNVADMTWGDNWAPRLGFVLDPTGEARAKLYASYGRYFAKIPNILAARAMTSINVTGFADYFDAALTMPVPDGVIALGTPLHFDLGQSPPSRFDPDSKSSFLDEAVVGFEIEAIPELSVGVRYIWRDLGRVLEDVGTTSLGLFFTDFERFDEEFDFYITNVGPGVPTADGVATYEKPIRNYQALEITADKRFSQNWALLASYRWSRLSGTFEGFFRNDNGQSDPGLTSLFDFPTNDPTYAELAPVYGFRGDIRYQGEPGAGPLPNDRAHQAKLYGTYVLENGLGFGFGFLASSGRPLTPLAAHPVYGAGLEIPEAPRGSGILTTTGFRKRSDFLTQVDLHVDYLFPFGDPVRLTIVADFFNLINQQDVLDYNEGTELVFSVIDPDFGQPRQYGTPFAARFGVRLEF